MSATFYGDLSEYFATAFMERWAVCNDNDERSAMLEHLADPGALCDWVNEILEMESISANLAAAIRGSIEFNDLRFTIMRDESSNYDCCCFKCCVPAENFAEFINHQKHQLLCGECDK
jgi:hypothetical protein